LPRKREEVACRAGGTGGARGGKKGDLRVGMESRMVACLGL